MNTGNQAKMNGDAALQRNIIFDGLTSAELRDVCKALKVNVDGTKAEMSDRIVETPSWLTTMKACPCWQKVGNLLEKCQEGGDDDKWRAAVEEARNIRFPPGPLPSLLRCKPSLLLCPFSWPLILRQHPPTATDFVSLNGTRGPLARELGDLFQEHLNCTELEARRIVADVQIIAGALMLHASQSPDFFFTQNQLILSDARSRLQELQIRLVRAVDRHAASQIENRLAVDRLQLGPEFSDARTKVRYFVPMNDNNNNNKKGTKRPRELICRYCSATVTGNSFAAHNRECPKQKDKNEKSKKAA